MKSNIMHEIHQEGEYIICFVCGKGKYGFALHHLQLRSQGGEHDIKNLVPLCTECHTMAHSSPSQFTKYYGDRKCDFLMGGVNCE